MLYKRRWNWLTAATTMVVATIGMTGILRASEDTSQPPTEASEREASENRYRIGLGCNRVSEPLAYHLGLPKGQGLLVESVLEGSPADVAGIARFDVISEADGVALRSVMDLVHAVNQAGTGDLDLRILRRGDGLVVKVRPELRPEDEIKAWESARDGWRQFEGMPPEVRRYLRQFDQMPFPELGRGLGWRQLRPGIVIDEEDELEFDSRPQLPDDFSLRIEKSGSGPARIHVQRGDEEWEVTEDSLDELPEDVRETVQGMLGARRRQGLPGLPGPNRMPRLPRRQSRGDAELQQRFDEMSTRMKQLQDAIESLRSEK